MREVDVDKMLRRIGNTAFMEWVAFYLIEQEDEAAAQKSANKQTSSSTNTNTITI